MKKMVVVLVSLIVAVLIGSCYTWINPSLSGLSDYQIQTIFAGDRLECDLYSEVRSKDYCKALTKLAIDRASAVSSGMSCASYKHLLYIECMKAKGWQIK